MITADDALASVTAMQQRLDEAHARAADDNRERRVAALHVIVPRSLMEYADNFADATDYTQQEIVEEALCLFYAIREIGSVPRRKPPRTPRRVCISRRSVRARSRPSPEK